MHINTKLQDIRYEIRGALQQTADEMKKQGESILHLNIGNPAYFGFHTPADLLHTYMTHLTEAEGYSESRGLLSARLAIMTYCRKRGMLPYSEDTVYTGNGVSEMILMSMQALLENGDEMLVPAPDYPLWTAAVRLSGGKAVHYICDEAAGWYPDIQDIERKITCRTRGIVLINPNNPTGALYPPEILTEIGRIAQRHRLILFTDEIYDRLIMDANAFTAMAAAAQDVPVVSFNGLSKSHLLSGFRCGWMCLCGDWSRHGGFIRGINLLASLRLCSNVPSQTIIPAALENDAAMQALLAPGGRIFMQRQAVCDALSEIPGISFCKPKAGFYIFPKIDLHRYPIGDDNAFASRLLIREKILITPGTGFNWTTPDHFRIVFLPDAAQLTDAVARIGTVLESFCGS